jgi:hypothetical protein
MPASEAFECEPGSTLRRRHHARIAPQPLLQLRDLPMPSTPRALVLGWVQDALALPASDLMTGACIRPATVERQSPSRAEWTHEPEPAAPEPSFNGLDCDPGGDLPTMDVIANHELSAVAQLGGILRRHRRQTKDPRSVLA